MNASYRSLLKETLDKGGHQWHSVAMLSTRDTLNFRIDRPLLKRLRKAAKNDGGRTIASIVREALNHWLEQRPKQER